MAILPVGTVGQATQVQIPDGLATAGAGSSTAGAPDAAGFDEAVKAAAGKPASGLMQMAHDMSAELVQKVERAPVVKAAADPQKLVQLQNEMFHEFEGVDLLSKEASGVAQAVNKLTTMQ